MIKRWLIALLIAELFGAQAFADCVPSPDAPASVIEYFQKFNKPLPEQFCAKEHVAPQAYDEPSRQPPQAYEDVPDPTPLEGGHYTQLTPRYAPHPEFDKTDVAETAAQEFAHAIVPDAPQAGVPSAEVPSPQATAPTAEVPMPQAGVPSAEVPSPQATAPTAEVPTPQAGVPSAEVPSPQATAPTAEVPMPQAGVPSAEVPSPQATAPTAEVPMPQAGVPSAEVPSPQATAPTAEVPTPQAGVPSAEVPSPQATAPTAEVPMPQAGVPSAEVPSPQATAPTAEVPTPQAGVPSAEVPSPQSPAPSGTSSLASPETSQPGPQSPNDQSPTIVKDQLVTITSAAIVRDGPSSSARIIGRAHAGAMARVAATDSGWAQVVDPASGNKGWVEYSVLAPSTTTAATDEMPAENRAAASKSKHSVEAKRHRAKHQHGRRRFVFRFAIWGFVR